MSNVTIEIPEDTYEYMKAVLSKLRTQDNRCTASPYYFTVRDEKKITGGDDHPFVYLDVNSDHEEYASMSEAISAYKENGGVPEEIDVWVDSLEKWHYQTVHTYKGHFLTEEACHLHMKQNKHHYSDKAVSFVGHDWCNPEMEKIHELIRCVGGQDAIE